MKRTALSLILASVLSATAIGQTEQWINYLDEEYYETAERAVSETDIALQAWLAAKSSHRDLLEALYIDARRENLTLGEYGIRMETEERTLAAAAENDALAAIRSGLAVLSEVVRRQPPPPASRFRSDAVRWLAPVVEAMAVDSSATADLLERIKAAGQNAEESAARAFVARNGIPMPEGFGDASPQDQLLQSADDWLLLFLCAPDDQARADRLAELGSSAQSVSAELAAEATALSSVFLTGDGRVRVLHRAVAEARGAVGAARIAALANRNLADVSGSLSGTERAQGGPSAEHRSGDDVDVARATAALSRLAEAVQASTRGQLIVASRMDAESRWTLETLGRLLSAVSDRQAFALDQGLGLALGGTRTVAGRLHRLRLDLVEAEYGEASRRASSSADRYRRTPEYQDESNLLAAHKSDGRSFVSSLEPWVTGRQARTGDSYKWAMLSVVSNRYSQHMLLTDPELEEEQRLVAEFVSTFYEGMIRDLSPDHTARLWRDPAPDDPRSFDRTYRLVVAEGVPVTIGPVYHSFVLNTHGEGLINANYNRTTPAERILATEWAHIHGMHLYQVDPSKPVNRLRSAALSWFTLAAGEQNEVQGFAHEIRGVLALAASLDYLLAPVMEAAAFPALRLTNPVLDVAMSHLRRARTLEVPPGETMAALTGLYPGATGDGDLIDRIEQDMRVAIARLAEVDAADRRLLTATEAPR